MKENLFSKNKDDFDIKDNNGDVCYKIIANPKTHPGREEDSDEHPATESATETEENKTNTDVLTINDAEGKPICIINAKPMKCSQFFVLSTFEPNMPE